jgi:flagellar biosynthetic protein FliQ
MTEEMVLSIGAEAIKTTIYLCGPLLAAAMVVGMVVSILQAITQINEATLTFIPKMIAIVIVMAVMAPWMLEVMKHYTTEVITQAGETVHQ